MKKKEGWLTTPILAKEVGDQGSKLSKRRKKIVRVFQPPLRVKIL